MALYTFSASPTRVPIPMIVSTAGISLEVKNLAGRQGAVIRIPVSEGPLYTVGEIRVTNVHAFHPSSLVQMCPLRTGQPFFMARGSSNLLGAQVIWAWSGCKPWSGRGWTASQ